MVTALALLLSMGFTAIQDSGQERPKIPKDSIQVVVTGCLKGRVLAVSDVRQPDAQSGPDIRNRSFRLSGKKDVMSVVKKEDGHIVEVTGILKKADLSEPGIKIAGGRVTVGGGSRTAGPTSMPDPADNVVVMDVLSLQPQGVGCSGSK
jgi:hypothetical protein